MNQSKPDPVCYEVDLETDEATGIVHRYCSEECRNADKKQLDDDQALLAIEFRVKLVDGYNSDRQPGERCAFCSKPFDINATPQGVSDPVEQALRTSDEYARIFAKLIGKDSDQMADILNVLNAMETDEKFTDREVLVGTMLFDSLCKICPDAVEKAQKGY